jgi:hypothetical protein
MQVTSEISRAGSSVAAKSTRIFCISGPISNRTTFSRFSIGSQKNWLSLQSNGRPSS